ncbi:hypothetical protein SSS_03629 [Sarcoptes scabiei]|nr:hypothetical protein SSS_03629 [Sarcoptes scabiei]
MRLFESNSMVTWSFWMDPEHWFVFTCRASMYDFNGGTPMCSCDKLMKKEHRLDLLEIFFWVLSYVVRCFMIGKRMSHSRVLCITSRTIFLQEITNLDGR